MITAGGEFIDSSHTDSSGAGYRTCHISLDYDRIVTLGDEPAERYKPTVGDCDGTYSPERGTRITRKDFDYRKVPAIDVLGRQLAQRFGIKPADWQVQFLDNTQADMSPHTGGDFETESMPRMRLTLQQDGIVLSPDGESEMGLTAGFNHECMLHPVTGWMACLKTPRRDDLMVGIRLYWRGEIDSQTSTLNRGDDFTREHSFRSYLAGEVHADWLDDDEDLTQIDRRDILWSDEFAASFRGRGQSVVKRINPVAGSVSAGDSGAVSRCGRSRRKYRLCLANRRARSNP